jgi:hypothetical protein
MKIMKKHTWIITFLNEQVYSPVSFMLEQELWLFILMGRGNRKKFGVRKMNVNAFVRKAFSLVLSLYCIS